MLPGIQPTGCNYTPIVVPGASLFRYTPSFPQGGGFFSQQSSRGQHRYAPLVPSCRCPPLVPRGSVSRSRLGIPVAACSPGYYNVWH